MKDKVLILIVIGLALVLGLTFWLSKSNSLEYQAKIEELQKEVEKRKLQVIQLRENIDWLELQDDLYSKKIDSLIDETEEYKAGRKYWFRQHQRIADSVHNLSISQQQEYWTKRYPPR